MRAFRFTTSATLACGLFLSTAAACLAAPGITMRTGEAARELIYLEQMANRCQMGDNLPEVAHLLGASMVRGLKRTLNTQEMARLRDDANGRAERDLSAGATLACGAARQSIVDLSSSS